MSADREPETASGDRRYVTFIDTQGVSRFVDGDLPPRITDYRQTPGMRTSILWGTFEAPSLPSGPQEQATRLKSVHPLPGGSVFLKLTLPPDTVYASPDFDPAAAAAEQIAAVPGIAERMEPDAPGFHRTDSLDYVILLDGEIWLVLDEGERRLEPGDVVVQIGARHAWQNRSDKSATLAVVLMGARL